MSVNYSAGLSPYMHKGKCGMKEKFDPADDVAKKVKILAEWIKESKLTVVHSGAGISTAAGIPDFRGPKGVWTLEEKGKSPECNITFEDAKPTYAHNALVQLEKQGLVHYVVSQNIDGLHLRSNFPLDKLSELHGNMFVRKCNLCVKEQVKEIASPTMALRFTGEKCEAYNNRGSKCRGKLRDTILDWEDSLPDKHLDAAEKACKKSTLSITLGTSLQILPAANLPLLTKKNSGKLVIVNLQPTKHDKKADLLINAFIDDVLKMLMDILNEPKEENKKSLDLSNEINTKLSNGKHKIPRHIDENNTKIIKTELEIKT